MKFQNFQCEDGQKAKIKIEGEEAKYYKLNCKEKTPPEMAKVTGRDSRSISRWLRASGLEYVTTMDKIKKQRVNLGKGVRINFTEEEKKVMRKNAGVFGVSEISKLINRDSDAVRYFLRNEKLPTEPKIKNPTVKQWRKALPVSRQTILKLLSCKWDSNLSLES